MCGLCTLSRIRRAFRCLCCYVVYYRGLDFTAGNEGRGIVVVDGIMTMWLSGGGGGGWMWNGIGKGNGKKGQVYLY